MQIKDLSIFHNLDDDEFKKSLVREFDSYISQKIAAGRIKPAFFMSFFVFIYVILCYCVI